MPRNSVKPCWSYTRTWKNTHQAHLSCHSTTPIDQSHSPAMLRNTDMVQHACKKKDQMPTHHECWHRLQSTTRERTPWVFVFKIERLCVPKAWLKKLITNPESQSSEGELRRNSTTPTSDATVAETTTTWSRREGYMYLADTPVTSETKLFWQDGGPPHNIPLPGGTQGTHGTWCNAAEFHLPYQIWLAYQSFPSAISSFFPFRDELIIEWRNHHERSPNRYSPVNTEWAYTIQILCTEVTQLQGRPNAEPRHSVQAHHQQSHW